MTAVVDEETPLLADVQPQAKPQITPLPWNQFVIVLFLQLAEPLTSQVIYPFTPELIRSLHVAKTEAEVGYYVGLMQSLFFLTQAVTVLHWSRLSDHIGRKPVILMGLCGLSISMYSFGLSTTFWGLVMSRALNGALNGNIGVIKSMMAELTDQTNVAIAYGYLPISWSTGGTIGPIIGGALSRPAERFPKLFGNSLFLIKHPYFLPCAVPATFTLLAWLVTFFFLKETVESPVSIWHLLGWKKDKANLFSGESTTELDASQKPLPLKKLLIRPVIVAAVNYALLAIVDIAFRALQPLFYSTPIELGGLGLDAPRIGVILSFFGILNGFFQVFCFARLNAIFGSKALFITGIAAAVPCFLLFPVANALARQSHDGLGWACWSVVALQVALSVFVSLCYGAVFIYIAAAAPNRASLGATNGIAQLLCSIVRAIGPAMTNSLFSLSIDENHHYLNGMMVYWVLLGVTAVAIWAGFLLPRKVWKDEKTS